MIVTTGVAIATMWATLVDEEAIPRLGLADDQAEAKLADRRTDQRPR
jgi:hypothetical protein